MASHGIARTIRSRTEEQRRLDLEKIARYRELEEKVRALVRDRQYTAELLQQTTALLRLNPEYYTIWNVRRRALLTSGLSSRRSAGCSRSKGSPSSSRNATITTSSAELSSSSSTGTPHDQKHPTTGPSGTTASDDGSGGSGEAAAAKQDDIQDQSTPAEAVEADEAVLRAELAFTIPLLVEFPKCYWIWNHRTWALDETVVRLPVESARRIWLEELGLVGKMLTRDRRNFHAWAYRRFVVARLESAELGGTSMVESEFEYTTRMINVDLSNMSAWHRRSTLIPRLLDERGADDETRKNFLVEELGVIHEALNVSPEDQSLWVYHSFLMLNLTSDLRRDTFAPNLTLEERVTYLTRDIEEIRELLDDYADQREIYKALVLYTLDLCRLEGHRPPDADELPDLAAWLVRLKELDPLREGLWIDLERELGLTRLGSRNECRSPSPRLARR